MIEKGYLSYQKTRISSITSKAHIKTPLKKSNFNYKLKCKGTVNRNNKKNRKRKCIFYNPPHSVNQSKKYGKALLSFVGQTFWKI